MSHGLNPLRQRGLSLLELLVAFAILALSLGVLYRITGASVRSSASVDALLRATTLAQSLLTLDAVPPGGWAETGESAGYAWQVSSSPFDTGIGNPAAPRLFEVLLTITWQDVHGPRSMQWSTLRPERKPLAGEAVR